MVKFGEQESAKQNHKIYTLNIDWKHNILPGPNLYNMTKSCEKLRNNSSRFFSFKRLKKLKVRLLSTHLSNCCT